ncbi:MAG: hypothetical protein V1725_03190 [archaeon]
MNKKGLVFTAPRDTLSFFAGVIIAIFGAVGALNVLGKLNILAGLFTSLPLNIIVWLVAAFGMYVVIDGFIEPPQHSLHWLLIAAGIVLLIIGLLPILINFGMLKFAMPAFINSLIVYYIVIAVEGVLLIIGGLTEH